MKQQSGQGTQVTDVGSDRRSAIAEAEACERPSGAEAEPKKRARSLQAQPFTGALQHCVASLRLMRSQIAGVPDFVQVQARGRELGDRVAGPGSDFDIEYLRADHAADRAFVHGEEAAALPSSIPCGRG